ncbi:hypothetical protein V5O48_003345 [Marasmius crinis-equi]|uniref:Ornithine cyclodeaminase n=1 Tax=Marasmius crinis-equi TaxID=585013 RepID=A0ABR3FT39_9AGAR
MSLLVLSANDVERVTSNFSPEYLQLLMADVFALTSSSATDSNSSSYTPHRIAIPTEHHKALFMPARISATGTTMKVVAVPTRSNDAGGLPASTIVLDKNSGAVKAIVNARSLTALRNAGGSLLSTTLVGPRNPEHIVAFGAGEQIFAHLDVHLKAFSSLRTCTIVNRSLNSRVQTVIDKLKPAHPSVDITVLTLHAKDGTLNPEVKHKLSNASIIITATPSKVPLFPSSWVPSGVHLILIGSYTPEMKEVDKDLVMRAVRSKDTVGISPRLLVDSVQACFREAGELLDAGLLEDQMQEIGTLVLEARARDEKATTKAMRAILWDGSDSPDSSATRSTTFDGPVTIFKSVGVGLQDVAIACAVVEEAKGIQSEGNGTNLGVLVDNYDKV